MRVTVGYPLPIGHFRKYLTNNLQVGERRTSDFRVADVVSVVTEELPAQVGFINYECTSEYFVNIWSIPT